MRLLVLISFAALVGSIPVDSVNKASVFSFVQFGHEISEISLKINKDSSGDELKDEEQTTGQDWTKLEKASALVKLGYDHWTSTDAGFRFKDSNKKKILDCGIARGQSDKSDIALSFTCAPQKDYESLMETDSPCWKPVKNGCPYGVDYIWGNWVKSQKFYTCKKKAIYGCSQVKDDKCVGKQTCFPMGGFNRFDLQPNPTSQFPVNQAPPAADKGALDAAVKAHQADADEKKKAADAAQKRVDDFKSGGKKEEKKDAGKGKGKK